MSPYREGDRRQDVRDLLAKRMVDLAKRTEPDRMDRAKSKTATAHASGGGANGKGEQA